MSQVLILQDSGINESLALTSVSGLLKAHGHSTRLILGDEERSVARAVRRLAPDLVVIPCPVGGQDRALADAAEVKACHPEAVVVLGGTSATFAPELASHTGVDFVCVGEAEYALLDVANRLDSRRPLDDILNLAFKRDGELVQNPLRPLIEDLDELPLPDRSLYYRYPFVAALSWKKFSTGRGCIHTCSYCWNTSLQEKYKGLGSFIRRKSPERAVREITTVQERWRLRNVHFSDDLFTVSPSWLEEFAERYAREVGLPFTCNTSASLATERSVEALRVAGCRGVAIGVETGNEELRSQILGKPVPDQVIRGAASRIKGAGLELYTYNMVGAPGETPDDVLKTIALNRSIGVDAVRVNMAVPLKHTAFRETAFTLGFLDEGAEQAAPGRLNRGRMHLDHEKAGTLEGLYRLFIPGVHSTIGLEGLRGMAERMPSRVLSALQVWTLLEERKLVRLSWMEAARFYRHVGDPKRRTANYVSLI